MNHKNGPYLCVWLFFCRNVLLQGCIIVGLYLCRAVYMKDCIYEVLYL